MFSLSNTFSLYKLMIIGMALLLGACSATSLQTQPADLGKASSLEAMLEVINQPGPILFEKHLAGNWSVPLSGLLNLDHPEAIAAGLEDRQEPIEINVYLLKHPIFGNFLIDSGVSESIKDIEQNTDLSFLIKKAMDLNIGVQTTTAQLVEQAGGIDGVFLTHIHLDHILGIKDLAMNTPVYLGSGDAENRKLEHLVTQGSTNRLLGMAGTLREWKFDGTGVIDIFGDGSLFAIRSAGHSPGSTAYLARTTMGPQLLVGDASHTTWGWTHGVEPGTYSDDQVASVESLHRLIKITVDNPQVQVHPGHQSF